MTAPLHQTIFADLLADAHRRREEMMMTRVEAGGIMLFEVEVEELDGAEDAEGANLTIYRGLFVSRAKAATRMDKEKEKIAPLTTWNGANTCRVAGRTYYAALRRHVTED